MDNNLLHGTVTFLDVLGWKGLWSKKKDAIDVLLDIVESAKKSDEYVKKEQKDKNGKYAYYDNLKLEVISISDTIVLITYGEVEAPLEFHAKLCSKILVNALAKGLLLRGAINCGDFNRRENIFIGPAIDEVASWHEITDWIGVIQTPSAYLRSINPSGKEFSMIEYDVPLKTKGKILTRCVNWTDEWRRKGKNELDLRNVFLEMGPIFPDIYAKIRNTLDFYKECTK